MLKGHGDAVAENKFSSMAGCRRMAPKSAKSTGNIVDPHAVIDEWGLGRLSLLCAGPESTSDRMALTDAGFKSL